MLTLVVRKSSVFQKLSFLFINMTKRYQRKRNHLVWVNTIQDYSKTFFFFSLGFVNGDVIALKTGKEKCNNQKQPKATLWKIFPFDISSLSLVSFPSCDTSLHFIILDFQHTALSPFSTFSCAMKTDCESLHHSVLISYNDALSGWTRNICWGKIEQEKKKKSARDHKFWNNTWP